MMPRDHVDFLTSLATRIAVAEQRLLTLETTAKDIENTIYEKIHYRLDKLEVWRSSIIGALTLLGAGLGLVLKLFWA